MDLLRSTFSSYSPSEAQFREAQSQFEEIERIFPKAQPNVNYSLTWVLAVSSSKSCEALINSSNENHVRVAKEYIRDYLYRVVHLLLTQSPSKLYQPERTQIESSLRLALNVMMSKALTREEFINNINILACLFGFERNLLYYAGHKAQWVQYGGFPGCRSVFIKKFAENEGFDLLIKYIFAENVWIGTDNLLNLLKATREAARERWIDQKASYLIADQSMYILMNIATDEQIKKSQISLADCIQVLSTICKTVTDFHQFWLKHTQKIMKSDNMLLKLFAWDQMGELVKEAEYTQPLAEKYIIYGAGCDFVNGIYEFNRVHIDKDKGKSNLYTKFIENKKIEHEISLIRCKMKEDNKKWFLSEIDSTNPGTNSDIDYYQQLVAHKPEFRYLEREPPLNASEWTPCSKGKHTGYNSWDEDIQANVFGGKLLYEKIPKDCPAYEHDKEKCGHYQGMRDECLTKVELQIQHKCDEFLDIRSSMM